MSENTLIEKITADADAEVEVVKAQAESDAAVVVRETEDKIVALQADAAVLLEKKKKQMELVTTSRAKQAGNIALQNAKRTQIDSIFTSVFDEMVQQSTGDYVAFYTAKATEQLPKDVTAVKVQAPASRLEETATILSSLQLDVTVESSNQLSAGLILFSQDGVYDISFDRLFAEKRAELEMVIANELVS